MKIFNTEESHTSKSVKYAVLYSFMTKSPKILFLTSRITRLKQARRHLSSCDQGIFFHKINIIIYSRQNPKDLKGLKMMYKQYLIVCYSLDL